MPTLSMKPTKASTITRSQEASASARHRAASLSGVAAVLFALAAYGTVAFPFVTAVVLWRTPPELRRRRALLVFIALHLVAYTPVFLVLDREVLAYAATVAAGGETTMLGAIADPLSRVVLASSIAAGPLMRALATLALLASISLR